MGLATIVDFGGVVEVTVTGMMLVVSLAVLAIVPLAAFATQALIERFADLAGSGVVEARTGLFATLDKRIVILTCVVGLLGPILVSRSESAPLWLRYTANMFAILPLLGVLLAMQWLEHRAAPDKRHRGRLLLGFALVVLAALLVLSVLQALVATSGPWMARLASFLVVLPAFVVAFVLFRAWPRTIASPQTDPSATADTSSKPGVGARVRAWWRRVVDWLWSLIGTDSTDATAKDEGAPEATESADTPPPWLEPLLSDLPEGCTVVEAAKKVEYGATSPISTSHVHLAPLFGGVEPTVDQATFVEAFASSFETVVEHIGVDTTTAQRTPPSADFLLLGEPGSGRTTSLLACAVHAAFVRGQRVLFIVSDVPRAEGMVARITSFLARAGLQHQLTAAAPIETNVRTWVAAMHTGDPSQSRSAPSHVPNILVATFESVERDLYGIALHGDGEIQALQRILRTIEVVLVDDLLDFEESERSHLPFFLGKHRLLLAAESMPLQTAVVCPTLAAVARSIVNERLFPVPRREHIVELRPREGQQAWRVELETTDVPRALEDLVVRCLDQTRGDGAELNVVLYRRGLDEHARRTLEGGVARRARRGRLTVVSDLDAFIPLPAGGVDAVFYQVAAHTDTCLALSLRFGSATTVVLSIRRQGDHLEPGPSGVVPLLAGRTAVPLAVAHLRNVLRFLRAWTPLDDSELAQLGIDVAALAPPGRERPIAALVRDALAPDPRYENELPWPYVVLSDTTTAWLPIDVHSLPSGSERIARADRGDALLVLSANTDPHEALPPGYASRWSRWQFESGRLLRLVDLAHKSDLRLATGTDAVVAERIEVRDKTVVVQVTQWRGDGTDWHLPVWDVAWGLPSDMRSEGHRGGGPSLGVSWYDLDVGAANCQVTTTLSGRMNDAGVVAPAPSIRIGWDAKVAAIVFQPRSLDPDSMADVQGQRLAGQWSSEAAAFRPALTAALTYAFNIRVPGLAFFAKVLAFELPETSNQLGTAVAFLLQPWGAGTVLQVLGRLLADPTERLSFFQSVDWFLGQLESETDRAGFLRRRARVAWGQSDRVESIVDTRALVGGILSPSPSSALPRPTPTVQDERPDLPTVDRVDEPATLVWDPDAAPTSWADCVSELFLEAVRRFPAFDTTELTTWSHEARVLVECVTEPPVDQRDRVAAAVDQRNLSTRPMGRRTCIVVTGSISGAEFKSAVASALQTAFQDWSASPVATFIMTLWIVPRALLRPGLEPHVSHPVNETIVGGLRVDGLIRALAPNTLATPAPPPKRPSRGLAEILPTTLSYALPPRGGLATPTWMMALPPRPEVGAEHGRTIRWTHRGRHFETRWGMASPKAEDDYLGRLAALQGRSNAALTSYIFNDPYLDAVSDLADHLLALYGGVVDSGFCEYLLAFVQSHAYVHDPEDAVGDFPRFPSEHLLHGGGDCEDSSITYVALLARFGYRAAFLDMPEHVLVGVVGPFAGSHYVHGGEKYHVAETATNGSHHPIGHGDPSYGPAQVRPYPAAHLPAAPPVAVLSVAYRRERAGLLRVIAVTRLPAGEELRVAAYVRNTSDPDAIVATRLAGTVLLPPLPGAAVGFTVDVPVAVPSDAGPKVTVDLVIATEHGIVGHWLASTRLERHDD